MLDVNDVLDVEIHGVKDEHQGNSFLVASGGGGATAELQGTEETWMRGKPHFLKKAGNSDVLEWKASSWEQMPWRIILLLKKLASNTFDDERNLCQLMLHN